jgi:pyruvate dehydrogenase E2 component (dihydrolipoamide acetyltransferase)
MAEAIYLPKVGMTMEEGTLTKWAIADGAPVARRQVVFEMETEKVQMEIEAEYDGTLKQLVPEGAVLKPGDVVGCILAAGEEVPQALLDRVATQMAMVPGAGSQSAAATEEATLAPGEHQSVLEAGTTGTTAAPAAGGPMRISPIARRLADESGIDVTTLTGSGPGGRVVERDVQNAIEAKASPPAAASPSPQAERGIEAQPSIAEAATTANAGATVIPYRGRRRTIGERMRESVSATAPVTLTTEAPMDAAMAMIHGLNREWRGDGVVVTLTGLVARACALALKEQPQLNARLEGDQILVAPEINVGVALDQDAGLIVPVVRSADRMSLQMVMKTLRELTQKAKEDKLRPDDVTGGTFTVSSLEGTVVDAFTPIINPPQAAILGLGRVREIAAFEGSDVVKRQAVTLSLTFDHRLTDGAPAARFLGRVAELLERPYLLM